MIITEVDSGRFVGSLEHRLFEDDKLMMHHIRSSLSQKRGLSPILWGIHFSLARPLRLPSLSQLLSETRQDIGLDYGFLGRSLVRGRTLDKLGVPNFCGEVDPLFLKRFEPIMDMMTQISERRTRQDTQRMIDEVINNQDPNDPFAIKLKTDDKPPITWLIEAIKNGKAPKSRCNENNPSIDKLEKGSHDILEDDTLAKFKMQISCPSENGLQIKVKNSTFGSNQNKHNPVGSTGKIINLIHKKKLSEGKIEMETVLMTPTKSLGDTINKIRYSLENKSLNKKPVPTFKPKKTDAAKGRAKNLQKIKEKKVHIDDDKNNICSDLHGLMNSFELDQNQTAQLKKTSAGQTKLKNKKKKLFSQTSDNGISSQINWKNKEKPKRQTEEPTAMIQREVSPEESTKSPMEVIENAVNNANRNSENVINVESKVYTVPEIAAKEKSIGLDDPSKEVSVRTPISSSNSYVVLDGLSEINHMSTMHSPNLQSKSPEILRREIEVEETASDVSKNEAMVYETTEINVDINDLRAITPVLIEHEDGSEEQNSAKEITENINEMSLNEAMQSEVMTDRNVNEKDVREVTAMVIEKQDSIDDINKNKEQADKQSNEQKEHTEKVIGIESVRPNKKNSPNKREITNAFNTKHLNSTDKEILNNEVFENVQIKEKTNQDLFRTHQTIVSREVVESFKTPLDTSSCHFELKRLKAHTLPKQQETSMSQRRYRKFSTSKMDEQKRDDAGPQKSSSSFVENIKKIMSQSKQMKDIDKSGILKALEDMQSFSLSPPSDEETNLWSLKPSVATNSAKQSNETDLAKLNSGNVTADGEETVAPDEMDLGEESSSGENISKLSSVSKINSKKESSNLEQLAIKSRTVKQDNPNLEEESNMEVDDGNVLSLNLDDEIYHSQQISSDSVATKDRPAALNTQQFKEIGFDSPEEEVQNFQGIVDDRSKKATCFPDSRNLMIDQTSSASQLMAKPKPTQKDASKVKSVKSKIADILNEASQYSSSSSSESYKKSFFTHYSKTVANNQNKSSDANLKDVKSIIVDYLDESTQNSTTSSNGSYKKLLEKHNYDSETSETFFSQISSQDTTKTNAVTCKMTTILNPVKNKIADILNQANHHNSASSSSDSYRKLVEKHNYDSETSETFFGNTSGDDSTQTKVVYSKVTNMLTPVKSNIANIFNQAMQDSTSSSNESYRKLIATNNYDTDSTQTTQSNQSIFFDED